MPNNKQKNAKNNNKTWSIIFTLIGVILTIIGIFNAISTFEFGKNAIETTAEVTWVSNLGSKRNKSSRVDISYVVNGKEYTAEYTTSSRYVRKGDNIRIYYDKDNPEKMKVTKHNVGNIIIILFGIIMSSLGFILIFKKQPMLIKNQ